MWRSTVTAFAHRHSPASAADLQQLPGGQEGLQVKVKCCRQSSKATGQTCLQHACGVVVRAVFKGRRANLPAPPHLVQSVAGLSGLALAAWRLVLPAVCQLSQGSGRRLRGAVDFSSALWASAVSSGEQRRAVGSLQRPSGKPAYSTAIVVVWAVFKGRRANLPTPPLLALGAGFLAAGLSVPRVRLGCLAFPLLRGGGPLSLSQSLC